MSAPSIRGQRGGNSTRVGRATQSIPPRGRGGPRGQPKSAPAGRGRGRGGPSANASAASGDGLLQRLRAGTVKRGSDNGTTTPTRGELNINTVSWKMIREAGILKVEQVGEGQARHLSHQMFEDEAADADFCRKHSIRRDLKTRHHQVHERLRLRLQTIEIS